MSDRSDRVDAALARLCSVEDEELSALSQDSVAQALFEEITSEQQAETSQTDRQPERRQPARRSHRRARLAWASALAAVVVVGAALGIASALHHASAPAAVSFSRSGGYIVARIADPDATAGQLRAAFLAKGLHIDLQLVPVSPSRVGSVVFMSVRSQGNGSGHHAITQLYSSTRPATLVGLRIPVGFAGQADIILGRAALPGETYQAYGDAFARGEALYKSGLRGMRVAEAIKVVGQLGLTAAWRDVHSSSVAAPTPGPLASSSASDFVQPAAIPDNSVIGAVSVAPDKVVILTSNGESPSPP